MYIPFKKKYSISSRTHLEFSSSNLMMNILLCTLFFGLLIQMPLQNASADEPYYHINLKDDDTIAPESKGNFSEEPDVKRVEPTNGQWVEIGRWDLRPRDLSIYYTIGRVNLWYSFEQVTGITNYPMFRYYLIIDEEVVQFNEGAVEDPGDEQIREKEFILGDERFDIHTDSSVQISFFYRGQETVLFYYDNATYDTGFHGMTDFIHFWNFTAKGGLINLEVYDVFSTDWINAGNYLELSMDGIPLEIASITTSTGFEHVVNGTTVRSTILIWQIEDQFEGSENVEVWLKYTHAEPDEDKGLSISTKAEKADIHIIIDSNDDHSNISSNSDDDFFGKFSGQTGIMIGGGIISLVCIGMIFMGRRKVE